MVLNFFTIGVYRTTEESFFSKIVDNKIDTFCDIRNRRGVRGSKYSYVNSKKLQEKLKKLNVRYIHVQGLAPTSQIRNVQKEADKREGVLKSSREELSDLFKSEYEKQILSRFDFHKFLNDLSQEGAKNIVLFCVEAEAKACHRSLVIEKLHRDFKFSINHI